jgi:hypothetical protein
LPNGSIGNWDNLKEAFIKNIILLLKSFKIGIVFYPSNKMIMNM